MLLQEKSGMGWLNRQSFHRLLLSCGIISSILYIVVVIIAPLFWESYDPSSQSVSELFAVGAPSARFVVPLFIVYSFLIYSFGVGIWLSAGQKRTLKIAAVLIIAKEILGLFGTLFAPMHLRGVEGTLTDTMHAVITGIGVLLCMFPAIGFSAVSLDKNFRLYSFATMGIFILFGALAGMDGPNVAANLPTPYLGIWERINIYAYMVWIIVLAIKLFRKPIQTL